MNKELKVLMGIGLAIIVAGIALFTISPSQPSRNNDQQIPVERLIKEDSHIIGNRGAKVTLVEFADFECPGCAQFYTDYHRLIEEYKGNPDVAFVFRHFPLPMHRHANITSRAAEAASLQGKFWEMHNKIFENQTEWANSDDALSILLRYAQEIGLNVDTFKVDLEKDSVRDKVSSDVTEGNSIGVDRTPTLFLNGVIQNKLSYDSLKEAIELELSDSK
jgi:protein-disulfide isomerase